MAKLSDTSAEAERVLIDVYRKMPFARKWHQMGEIFHTAKVLHAAGARLRNPAATDQEIHEAWMAAVLGEPLLCAIREATRAMPTTDENLQVLLEVVAVLTRHGIAYALGGSWASSLLGQPRFTQDADMSVQPFPGQEAAFCDSFGEDYYVSLPAVRQAVRQRSSFNVVNTRIGFKIDVFVCRERPFEKSVMDRRRTVPLPGAPAHPLILVSPEDIVLLKLEWYRLGNETSDQQWNDILGVLKVQAGKLDQAYLDHWAADLKVSDLLARARQESGS